MTAAGTLPPTGTTTRRTTAPWRWRRSSKRTSPSRSTSSRSRSAGKVRISPPRTEEEQTVARAEAVMAALGAGDRPSAEEFRAPADRYRHLLHKFAKNARLSDHMHVLVHERSQQVEDRHATLAAAPHPADRHA